MQVDGSWKCGKCGIVNRRASKECSQCHFPFYSLVTTAAPAQIFCSRCGFINDGDNRTCVQCDYTIRSTLDKISTDLQDSTNFLARDMGVNIHVKCPGCFVVCYVPPATACLRCGACHTYFASPSVGEVTNFHMNRLASSISNSFIGFFGRRRGGQDDSEATRRQEEAREAPFGKLIAAGKGVVQSPRHVSTSSEACELSSSLQLLDVSEVSDVSEDEAEEKANSCQVQQRNLDSSDQSEEKRMKLEPVTQTSTNTDDQASLHSDLSGFGEKVESFSIVDLSSSSSFTKAREQPMLARPMPMRAALPPPRQELVEVEGDIVEL